MINYQPVKLFRHPVISWGVPVLVVSVFAWAGYRAGLGSESGAGVRTPQSREASVSAGRLRRTRSEGAKEVVRRLLREDPSHRNQIGQLEAWEQVRGFSLEQVKSGLEITGGAGKQNEEHVVETLLFYRWGELDPQEAMRRARLLPGAFGFAEAILSAWAKRDPEAAYRWSLGEQEFSQQLNIGRMLAGPLMAEPAATGMAKSIRMGAQVTQQYCWSLGMGMASDPASRAEFLSVIPQLEEKERNDALAVMINTWARSSPEEELKAWDTLPIAPDKRSELLTNVIGIWGRKDPEKAIEWVGTHPGETGDAKQADIYQSWSSTDAEAAGRWLATQSDSAGIAADLVRQLYARSLQDVSGDIWWEMKQKERESIRQHYKIWAEAKPGEAAQWLTSLDAASAKSITEGTNETH